MALNSWSEMLLKGAVPRVMLYVMLGLPRLLLLWEMLGCGLHIDSGKVVCCWAAGGGDGGEMRVGVVACRGSGTWAMDGLPLDADATTACAVRADGSTPSSSANGLKVQAPSFGSPLLLLLLLLFLLRWLRGPRALPPSRDDGIPRSWLN